MSFRTLFLAPGTDTSPTRCAPPVTTNRSTPATLEGRRRYLRRMRLPALVLCGLLAACSSSGSPAAQPTPATSTAGPTVTTTPSAGAPSPTPTYVVRVVPTQAGRFDLESFQSPSGNIRCSMGLEEDGGGWARCDVYEHSWAVPPRPADCDLDWGSIATISTKDRKGTMGACASDAAGGPDRLEYGHALRLGAVECRSGQTGMECLALRTRHGFFVSKASYRLF